MEPRARITSLFLATALAMAPTFAAAASFDEAVSGDMSGNRLAPSSLSLDPGANMISGVTVAGDLDYLTVHVPAGYAFAQLILTSFVSTDDIAFIGIQQGTTFTESNTAPDVTKLLGWSHFYLPVGQDFLALLGQGGGAIGFTGPLPAGDYTFWIQQVSAQTVGYSFNAFVTVAAPEPEIIVLLGAALAVAAVTRRRRAG